jgi:hypothetical protein
VSKTELYKPETIEGIPLVKLFQQHFKITTTSSKKEHELRGEIL